MLLRNIYGAMLEDDEVKAGTTFTFAAHRLPHSKDRNNFFEQMLLLAVMRV